MKMNVRKIIGSVVAAVALCAGVAQVADSGSASNYVVNHFIDSTLRGQTAYTPATVYVALATTSGSSAACGTEETGTGYARVAVTSSLANWAATQGGNGVSSGTSGTTSNLNVITFGAPTSSWGTIVSVCVFDSLTSGGSNNLIFQTSLTNSKVVNNGDAAPSFAVAALSWTVN